MRKKFQDRLADASTTAEETISSIRTVRGFSGEERSRSEYAVNIDASYKEGKKLAIASGMLLLYFRKYSCTRHIPNFDLKIAK